MGTVKERSLARTQECYSKGQFSIRRGASWKKGITKRTLQNQYWRKEAIFNLRVKWGALRFDQRSCQVRWSEQTESQKANVRVELEDVKGVRYQCARGQFGNYYVSSTAVLSCGLACFAELRDTLELTILLYWIPYPSWSSSTQSPPGLYETFLDPSKHRYLTFLWHHSTCCLYHSFGNESCDCPMTFFVLWFNFYLRYFTFLFNFL